MFRKNNVSTEQMNLFSRTDNWSNYKLKRIKKGWPELFRTKIMPNIDEEPYSVLYSDKGSRPNTPVNILIGILILKSLLGNSDEEMLDDVLFNEQVQYALGTLDYEEQPISKNMISNFRMRIFNYEKETGKDLFNKTLKEINENIIEINRIDKSLKRADSFMISSSCRNMTRVELIYKVNEIFIKLLDKIKEYIPKRYKCYLKEENEVDVLYRMKEEEVSGKLTMLLDESLDLYRIYKNKKSVNETEEFKNLERLINDQYDEQNKRPKTGKEIKPTSMQTPYDKDATYRFKYDHNKGYVGNIVEAVDEEEKKVLITDWDVAPNIKSDKEFMEEMVENKAKENPEEKETIVIDSNYYSSELKELAEENNIELHPTDLTGQKEIKSNVDEFEIENKSITKCPMKKEAKKRTYSEKSKTIYADFEKTTCENCPQKGICPVKILKTKAKVIISEKKIEREKIKKLRNTEEYKKISRIRSGIEGIPSLLRRKYNIDNRGSKGLSYLSMVLSTSIVSINIKRTVKYENNKEKYDLNISKKLQLKKLELFLM